MCATVAMSACGGDDKTESLVDASVANDGGAPAVTGLLDCYPAPTTYLELINACTSAERVTKNPVLPLLLVGWRLPPPLELALALCITALTAGARADDQTPLLRLGGLVQVDSIVLDQTSVDELDPATREPLNNERFVLQRAWLRADARYKYVRGLVVAEGTTAHGPGFRLFAAELGLFYPDEKSLVDLTLGLFLIPFGIETQESVERRCSSSRAHGCRGSSRVGAIWVHDCAANGASSATRSP